MMGGFGMSTMMAWMPLLALFWIVVIAVVVWLVIRWFNHRQIPPSPSGPPPQQQRPYEQGYQPPSQPLQTEGTYQEGGMVD